MLRALILAAPFALSPLGPVALAQTNEAPAPGGGAQVILPDSRLAEENPALFAVLEGMGLYDILQIMSSEGIEASLGMEGDMFPGQGGSAWAAVVARVYSADRLIADFEEAVPQEMFTEDVLAELSAFIASDLGQRIVAGEVGARRTFLEPGVEEAAREIVSAARAEADPRIDLLSEFIEVNDLIERNVSGALNSNFAFYLGLADGGAFDVEMPEDLMLAEVWGQEPEIRSETTDWLYAYQMAAYADLSDADMRAYIDMTETPAGEALNAALFAAFDVMFERVSYDLGAAAAVFIAGEET